MGMALTKTLTAAALAGAIALTTSVAPAAAAGQIWHHGGGGGYHGGGGWHHGGGWGWGPYVAGGLLAGAVIGAATAPYYYGGPYGPYYGDPCYRPTPTYDAYGNYVGRHWARVC